MKRKQPLKNFITDLGGLPALQGALAHYVHTRIPTPTLRAWLDRGAIPHRWAAPVHGLSRKVDDFKNLPDYLGAPRKMPDLSPLTPDRVPNAALLFCVRKSGGMNGFAKRLTGYAEESNPLTPPVTRAMVYAWVKRGYVPPKFHAVLRNRLSFDDEALGIHFMPENTTRDAPHPVVEDLIG